MATETVVPELVEGKENEEPKTIEKEIISSPIAEKTIPEAPLAESEEKTDDKKIDQPVIVEDEKVGDAPVLDAPVQKAAASTPLTEPEENVSSVPEPAITDVPEPAVESVEKSLESLPIPEPVSQLETILKEVPEPAIKDAEKETIAEAAPEPEVVTPLASPPSKEPESIVETEVEQVSEKESEVAESVAEEPKVDIPSETNEVEKSEPTIAEPAVELAEKTLDSPPIQEHVSEVPEASIKDTTTREPEVEIPSEPKEVENSDAAVEVPLPVNEEVPEPSIKDAERETIAQEPKEIENSEAAEEIEKPVAEISVSESKAVELTEPVVKVEEKPQEDTATVVEIQKKFDENVEPKDDNTEGALVKEEGLSISEVEEAIEPSVETETSKATLASETPSAPIDEAQTVVPDLKESATEVPLNDIKVEEEKIESEKPLDIATKEKKEDEPLIAKTEEVVDPVPATVIAESQAEEPSKDVEVVAEEPSKVDIVAPVKTEKTAEKGTPPIEEKKVDDDNTVVDTASEPVSVPKETDVDDLKTKQVPKKQSNSIISKVKQSLVKVKKAIVGKSPNSKIVTTDVKEDVKVTE